MLNINYLFSAIWFTGVSIWVLGIIDTGYAWYRLVGLIIYLAAALIYLRLAILKK